MEIMQWSFVDKSKWQRGPWDSEPDKLQWPDLETGLPCLIHRAGVTGALCGYVGVAPGHPWYGVKYEEIEPAVDVHGGLTYSDFCFEVTEADGRGICHVPDEGDPEKVWWLGFDCAHCNDESPAINAQLHNLIDRAFETYRTLEYVQQQCRELAKQVMQRALFQSDFKAAIQKML